MAQVTFKNVSGTVQGGGAVHDFSLEVRDRELIVLAGPAGCGASALLRLLAGLDPVSAGEFVVGNRPVTALPPAQRDVAMVFAHGALVPTWNVAENIAFGLKGQHFPASETGKRVRQAAEVAGFTEKFERLPAALSPVETFRVALARAIIRQPKAILVEDILAQLPADRRTAFRAELVKLQERLQATLIYATADPLTAATLPHRVALIDSGTLKQFDTPAEIYRRPANRFAAGFLGGMNFLAGHLRAAKGGNGFVFKETAGTVELPFPDRPALAELAGRELVLGVRPEHVRPSASGDGNKRTATGQSVVDAVEVTGPEIFYTLQTGASTLHSRRAVTEPPAGVGRRMPFDIDPSDVHFFDVISGARLDF
ncbi:MAG: ABC transporter ATP-binding protein [Chthoniobacteraceae bacterium]